MFWAPFESVGDPLSNDAETIENGSESCKIELYCVGQPFQDPFVLFVLFVVICLCVIEILCYIIDMIIYLYLF